MKCGGEAGLRSAPIAVLEIELKKSLLKQCTEANRELWLLLSLFVIAALCNFLIANRGMLLSFYTFPDIVFRLLLRTASRDADRAGQRIARGPDHICEPKPVWASGRDNQRAEVVRHRACGAAH